MKNKLIKNFKDNNLLSKSFINNKIIIEKVKDKNIQIKDENSYNIYIYNYKEINLLSSNIILIDNIKISGKDLYIKELDDYFLIIIGILTKVEIINEI